MENKQLEHIKEIARRKEAVYALMVKYKGEGAWDAMRARDIDPEIIDHVKKEIELGTPFSDIRKQLGVRSPESPQWKKIMAAIKGGWRVDGTALFTKMLSRQERMAERLSNFLDQAFRADEEYVKSLFKTDEEGVPLMESFIKYLTPMIDALGRNQKTTVDIGKALGVFLDQQEGKTGSQQIIIMNNVPIPTVQQVMDARAKKTTVEVDVVKPKA